MALEHADIVTQSQYWSRNKCLRFLHVGSATGGAIAGPTDGWSFMQYPNWHSIVQAFLIKTDIACIRVHPLLAEAFNGAGGDELVLLFALRRFETDVDTEKVPFQECGPKINPK